MAKPRERMVPWSSIQIKNSSGRGSPDATRSVKTPERNIWSQRDLPNLSPFFFICIYMFF